MWVIRGKLRLDHVRMGLVQGWGSLLDRACLAHMKLWVWSSAWSELGVVADSHGPSTLGGRGRRFKSSGSLLTTCHIQSCHGLDETLSQTDRRTTLNTCNINMMPSVQFHKTKQSINLSAFMKNYRRILEVRK